MSSLIDLTGNRYGRLLVLRREGTRRSPCGSTKVLWRCLCDCGNETVVAGSELKTGKTKSCGCYHKETIAEIGRSSRKHGDSQNSRLYTIWSGIIQRCQYPKHVEFYRYGGRGISVCDEWRDYSNFKNWAIETGYNDNDKLSIDRVDNDGDYSPDNCKWSTVIEQSNNRSSNVYLTYNGETKTVSQWARDVGIKRDTLAARINRGWDIGKALYTPVDGTKRRKATRK